MNIIPDPGEWSLGVGCAIIFVSCCLIFPCGLVLYEPPPPCIVPWLD
jgi:hypothetical protein